MVDVSWSLTMSVMVRDRVAENRDSAPIVRALIISSFCSRCGIRRGTPETVRYRHFDGSDVEASQWSNPCGHPDIDEDIITEAELACVVSDCVLLVSDIHYPYCSSDCRVAASRVAGRRLPRLAPRLDRPAL